MKAESLISGTGGERVPPGEGKDGNLFQAESCNSSSGVSRSLSLGIQIWNQGIPCV